MREQQRRRRRAVAAGIAVALALASAGSTLAYTVLSSGDQNRDGYAETWLLDDNGDGRTDRVVIDGNRDGSLELQLTLDVNGRALHYWLDSNYDLRYDTVVEAYYANGGTGPMAGRMLWRDDDQNGLWENRYYDGQLDGYYEWVMVDSNLDGVADSWRANVAPAGQGATAAIARSVASISAVNILASAGIPVFYP